MKLVIDIGNSLAKLAVFNGNEIIDFQTINKVDVGVLNITLLNYPQITSSILSSVAQHDIHINELLTQHGFFIELSQSTPVPFINKYSTPDTLGKDRIAIASAAVQKYPNENVLIIDTGTSITYDFVNNRREYLGGGISPGLNMRFKALHNFTHRLPLIHMPDPEEKINLVGDSTESSILTGVVNGLKAEVESTINQYNYLYSPLKVVISGGDYKYFEKLVKSNIFASPNIVIWGLKNILDFNESN
ncbi:MAG: type III pantothenate kinase [Bacteroidetes bacterium]|nr:type III pantothenate kinase [Bacteroidota bacterium]MBL6943336.1 type III pantothenate kinase [Bacteroidales bacterium]